MARAIKETGKVVPGYEREFGDRLQSVISRIGTMEKASVASGASIDQLTSWKFGRSRPDFFALQRLCASAGMTIQWLATGEDPRDSSGEMRQISVGTQPEQTGVPAVIYNDPSAIADDAMVLIPLLDVQPSAGSGTIVEVEAMVGRVAFDAAWLRSRNITPQAAHVLTARGDSMEPTIRSGDTLIVDTAISEVVDNGIYVIAYSDTLLVKRLHRKLDGSIVISSDNRLNAYDETVPAHRLETLRVAGRVMWYGRII